MSRQPRIDQFYKSVSGAKKTAIIDVAKKGKGVINKSKVRHSFASKKNAGSRKLSVKDNGNNPKKIKDSQCDDFLNMSQEDKIFICSTDEFDNDFGGKSSGEIQPAANKSLGDATPKLIEENAKRKPLSLLKRKKDDEGSSRSAKKLNTSTDDVEKVCQANPVHREVSSSIPVDETLDFGAELSGPKTPKVTQENAENFPSKMMRESANDDETNKREIHQSDTDLIERAIKNLILAKEGRIQMNDFDLESIYSEGSFDSRKSIVDGMKCDMINVKMPRDRNAYHLFMALINVFAEPINCGYFDQSEAENILSIFTLSSDAQALLIRMLKRKRNWYIVERIKYPEIADDLKPIFDELIAGGILNDDIKNESILTLLNLLRVDEIKTVCQALNINHKGTKPALIGQLVKLSERKKSLFPGMKSPSLAMTEKIAETLGRCIRLHKKTEMLLRRIFILLIPNEDPQNTMAETFHMLFRVQNGEIIFPPTPTQRHPIFRNRLHLIRYAEARDAWSEMLCASEAKDWDKVRDMGQLAFDRVQNLCEDDDRETEESGKLPSHIKRFKVAYVWGKVLWGSVEGFKKIKEGIDTAAKVLRLLISQRDKFNGNSKRWFSELALIEMHHRKDIEASASVTIQALTQEKISETDFADMSERARKILNRSKGVSAETKKRLLEITQSKAEITDISAKPYENIIEAAMLQGNTTGSKSTWAVNMGDADVGYLKVEEVALVHYSEKGYNKGLHCEGALPVSLFATVLWNEIYDIAVPGVFVSAYQEAPLDLYTSKFFEHRREHVNDKLDRIRKLDIEDLSEILSVEFLKNGHYTSLLNGNLFQSAEDFKDFVQCLGTTAVVGICERMAKNYNQWKSGFPDLAVWDRVNKKCKFIEVKGPGDTLSIKQKLWIQFLNSLDVDVEVCIVKSAKNRYGR